VTANEYEQLWAEEKVHFAPCGKCGAIFDRRSLDEVPFHTDHKHRPDIQVFRLDKAVTYHVASPDARPGSKGKRRAGGKHVPSKRVLRKSPDEVF
jgi:Zn ribbon nucleic-acid-binding protein